MEHQTNNIEALVVGVVSGVIAAMVIHLLLLLLNKIVLPWYRQLVYRGVEIDGKWEENLDFGNGNTQVATAEIKQRAHDISGNITVVKSTDGRVTKAEVMYIKGSIKDRLFNSTLTPVDKKRVGSSVRLLEVIGDGSRMRGVSSWYDAGAARISSKESEWIRI